MRLFELSFWFDARPLPFNQASYYIIGAIFLLGIALGIISQYFKKKYQNDYLIVKIWQKLLSFGYSFAIVGFLLTFLKQQRIIYLGMRIWLVLWLLASLIWLFFILKYILVEVPGIKKKKQEKAELNKYIPK